MKIKVILEESDLDSLHDTLHNALYDEFPDRDYSIEEINNLWNSLPDDIVEEAIRWGVDDTPVRDNIYTWIKDNKFQP